MFSVHMDVITLYLSTDGLFVQINIRKFQEFTRPVINTVNAKELELLTAYFVVLRITAVPLTRRDMDWEHRPETVTRMDAGVELPWTGSRRVSGRCYRFMSRIAPA